ncbi:MAG TPA: hypothetical protein PKE26_03625 [Kiritimatiellia bacterium]|nr:hypothetical protein [Kiritimatiellia bacterium]HMO98180.1 hypothetical protein [Kiritimatiellia bacterium]
MTITKHTLIAALSRLGELADKQGLTLEVCLYGGALMMLVYDARTITKDVDAIIHPSREGRVLVVQVARELGLPEDWLNDHVRIFLAPSEQLRPIPWEGPGIKLTAPTAGYLLAMKALACRDPLPGYGGDLDDLRFLIRKIGIRSVVEIQDHIDKYYPDDVITKEHEVVLTSLIEESI